MSLQRSFTEFRLGRDIRRGRKANIMNQWRIQRCNMNYLRFQSIYFERFIIDIDLSRRGTMYRSGIMWRIYQCLIDARLFVWVSWGIHDCLCLFKCLRPWCFTLQNNLWFLLTSQFDIDFTNIRLLRWRYRKRLMRDVILFQLWACIPSSFQRRH